MNLSTEHTILDTLDRINYSIQESNNGINNFKYELETEINKFNLNYIRMMIANFIMLLLIVLTTATLMIVNCNSNKSITQAINNNYEIILAKDNEIALLNAKLVELQEELTNLTTEPIIEDSDDTTEPKITYNNTDITFKSGYTVEQFTNIIATAFANMNKSETLFASLGEGLYQAEQEYDVNGLYLLGIASIESGWGTSSYARNKNNIYGLVDMEFESLTDCTIYMGKLIRNSYLNAGYTSLYSIQRKYCPNGGSTWVNNITWCTNKYIDAAIQLYSTQ